MPLPPLITIVGPTASGKTDLAITLAKKFKGEIINADSRQIYREIDIASAKPEFENWKLNIGNFNGIPHHLFDILSPDDQFNVTHFKKLALKAISDIHAREKLPFLVGGTGLWISALTDSLDFPAVVPNEKIRAQFEKLTTQELYQELIASDPEALQFIDNKNRRRIIRALEIISATGKSFSSQRRRNAPLFHALQLGVIAPMSELEKRIASRLATQIAQGLEQEARALFLKYSPLLPALSSIGVREWKDYFEGKQSLEETRKLIYLHTRQYAKRQMTWFKRDTRIHWIQNKKEAINLVHSFLRTSPPF